MDKETAIKTYQWLDNHLGQDEMDYVDGLIDRIDEMEADFRAIQESIKYIPTYHLSGEAKVFLQRMIDICEKYSTEPVQ